MAALLAERSDFAQRVRAMAEENASLQREVRARACELFCRCMALVVSLVFDWVFIVDGEM